MNLLESRKTWSNGVLPERTLPVNWLRVYGRYSTRSRSRYFVFSSLEKSTGGTALMLLLDIPRRFSTDIDRKFSLSMIRNRRKYICGFYHSDNHGEPHRKYQFLTPQQAEEFVIKTSNWVKEMESRFFK